MTFGERLIEAAAKYVGFPYIWGGKGKVLWTAEGLMPSIVPGFDCSGLITNAINEAGGPDWRGSHSAQSLFQALPAANVFRPHLRFYGPNKSTIHHVALGVPVPLGPSLVIEAAGGDEHTVSPTEGARVFFRYESRRDLMGTAALPTF